MEKQTLLERDFPLIAAAGLVFVKLLLVKFVGKYDFALAASDVAFSGFAFDLWALSSVVVYDQQLSQDDPVQRGEKLFIVLFPFLHLVTYCGFLIPPSTNLDTYNLFSQYSMQLMLFSAALTYVCPVLLLHRKFRNQ